jgi:hypothetical protein
MHNDGNHLLKKSMFDPVSHAIHTQIHMPIRAMCVTRSRSVVIVYEDVKLADAEPSYPTPSPLPERKTSSATPKSFTCLCPTYNSYVANTGILFQLRLDSDFVPVFDPKGYWEIALPN